MPKPVRFGLSMDRFTVGTRTRIDFCGVNFDPRNTQRLSIRLSATNHYWVINQQHRHSNHGVRVDATPGAKNGYTRDGEDDLTVTITVDEGTPDEETTEVTYEDIIYEGHLLMAQPNSPSPKGNKKGGSKKK